MQNLQKKGAKKQEIRSIRPKNRADKNVGSTGHSLLGNQCMAGS